MEKESFDIIYSLGFNCDCASFLKRYSLRSCSGPFDWVGVSSFQQRIDLILEDFKGFLEYHDLELISPSDGFKEAYQSKKTNMSFRHDFNISRDLKREFANVKAKYERRIARFYKNIEESEDILFVYMATNEFLRNEVLTENVQALEAKLGKKISFTVIQQDDSVKKGDIVLENISANIKSYHLDFYNAVDIIDKKAAKLLKEIFINYESKGVPRGFLAKLKIFLS